MSIPVANIFYLFCYAWDQFQGGEKDDVGGLESPRLQDLIGRVLINGTNRIIRRGLDRSYIEEGEDTARLRGRLQFNETIKRNLLQRRTIHCLVDELSPDILHNQILRATIRRLSLVSELDKDLKEKLSLLYRELDGISDIRLTRGSFSRVQIHKQNAEYRFLMRVCALAFEALLPEEDGAGFRFQNVLDDETRMSNVFEHFVRNFYKREQRLFKLGPRTIRWDIDAISDEAAAILPSMVNDIRLDRPGETIVIDTKYYAETLRSHFNRRIVSPGNLYQIFTYIKNLAPNLSGDSQLSGVLLYPCVSDDLDLEFVVQGHTIKICTINLDQPWPKIHDHLISLIGGNMDMASMH